MSKWESVKLGDVCGFINGDRGKNYPSGKDIVAEGVPFINAASELYHKLAPATGINTNYNSKIINPIAFLRYLFFIP